MRGWLLAAAVTGTLARTAAGPAPAESAPSAPVAIVTGLSGGGGVLLDGGKTRPLRLFAWLRTGTILRTASDGQLTIALADGRRYALGPGAETTVTAGGLTVRRGDVRTLPPVPALPRLGHIRERHGTRSRGGAARIRDGEVAGLYPAAGAAALADAAVLRFDAVEGAAAYAVDVQDEAGRVVYRHTGAHMSVAIPAGALAPGRRYHWTVRSSGGRVATASASFTTLSAAEGRQRAALQAATRALDDVPALSLAVAVDLELQLWQEAREGLSRALARTPGDPALQRALRELEERLAPPAPLDPAP